MILRLRARFVYIAKRRVQERDVEDLAHEACLTVLARYAELEAGTEFEFWAYQVLRNKIGNYLRHAEVARRTDAPLTDRSKAAVDAASDPEVVLTLSQCLRKLMQANPRYARALNLHYHGYDTEEICRKLGVGRSNLYSMLSRARTVLGECLFGKGDKR